MSSKCAPNFSAISKETKKTAENLDVLNNQLLEIGTKFQITSQALTNGGDSLFTSMQAFVEELATSIPSALSDTASNIGFIVVDTWKKLVTAFFGELPVLFSGSLQQSNEDLKTIWAGAVSYTHLDVYKRQGHALALPAHAQGPAAGRKKLQRHPPPVLLPAGQGKADRVKGAIGNRTG